VRVVGAELMYWLVDALKREMMPIKAAWMAEERI